MEKEKRKNPISTVITNNGIVNKRFLYEVMILSVVMLIANILPFVSYTYRKVRYGLTGIDFVLGKTISGGKVIITTNMALCVAIAATIGIFIIAILYPKMKIRLASGILSVLCMVVVIGNVLVVSRAGDLLIGSKNVSASYGSLIIVLLAIVILIQNMYILWKVKMLSTLDFMVLPGMMYFVINNYIPMVGILIAFKKINYRVGILKSPWVGFDNFKILFYNTGSVFDSDAFIITRNTLLYNFTFILLGTIMGVIVGICLADIFSKILQRFFQTTILLPQLISMVIVAYIVYAFFSNEAGMINSMLGDENAINFYATKKFWPFILVFVYVWKQIGYSAIIFLSSIVGIDKSLYEAASVDGANKLKQIRFITLPMLKPTIVTLVLLQVGRIFYSDFGLFYQVPMNSGALYSVTNTVDTYVYRALMVLNNISTASAVSTYQAVVGFALVFTVNMLVRKYDKENALF